MSYQARLPAFLDGDAPILSTHWGLSSAMSGGRERGLSLSFIVLSLGRRASEHFGPRAWFCSEEPQVVFLESS